MDSRGRRQRRYQQQADAYLTVISDKNKKSEGKTAIVISPTHAECDRVVRAVRMELRKQGKLGEERLVDVWVPTHLSDAQKSNPTEYDPGWLVQFTQNAKGGIKKGVRLIAGADGKTPVELANRFEVYRPIASPWRSMTGCSSPPAGKQRMESTASLMGRFTRSRASLEVGTS